MTMVCRPGLFVGMSYLNYVTVPPFMPAYVTFRLSNVYKTSSSYIGSKIYSCVGVLGGQAKKIINR
jgi:hypothetical protein